jgi:hypothetical protein
MFEDRQFWVFKRRLLYIEFNVRHKYIWHFYIDNTM